MSRVRPHQPSALAARGAVILLLAVAGSARGAEAVVQGEVVRVEALAPSGTHAECGPRPPGDSGLADLLSWDLRIGCRAAGEPVQGYRVHYRWDGRTYSRIMGHRPGDTIPLRVRID